MRNMVRSVPLRRDPSGNDAAEDQPGDDRLVTVSTEQQSSGIVARDCHHRCLDGQ